VAKLFADTRWGHQAPFFYVKIIMATNKKPRSSKASAPAPKVEVKAEAPKAEAPKVEEPKVEPPKIDSNPVKVEEPKRMKLEKYERPVTNQHEGESKWVDPEHGITQHLYGMGRLKHRMRTRKSRYEQ
jgi:hypothetical protein